MTEIEEVKKLIDEVWDEAISRMRPHPKGTTFPEYNLRDIAQQIYQLFEPKYIEFLSPIYAGEQPKPDESRLVTDDCYIDGLREKAIPLWEVKHTYEKEELRKASKAQRDLTASIYQQKIDILQGELEVALIQLNNASQNEYQQKIEEIFKKIKEGLARMIEKRRDLQKKYPFDHTWYQSQINVISVTVTDLMEALKAKALEGKDGS